MANNNFNHFGAELERVLAAAEKGMEKAVTELEADTKNITHVKTGALKRSWTHRTQSKNGNVEGQDDQDFFSMNIGSKSSHCGNRKRIRENVRLFNSRRWPLWLCMRP